MIVVKKKLKSLFPNTTETRNSVGRIFVVEVAQLKSTKSDIEVKQFLKQISSYTSHFCEDETISSPKEALGAQAGN